MAAPSFRGKFVWHDLMTTDPARAIAFYGKVAGWTVQPHQMDPSYRMISIGDSGVGGVMDLPEQARSMGAPTHWISYIATPDVDATVRDARAMGATVYVEPADIPNVGRFAILADPEGASFAAFCPSPAMPGEGVPEAPTRGHFSWHELAASNWKAEWDFYVKLFGWVEDSRMDMGATGPYVMFKRAGGTLPVGAMFAKSPDMKMPTAWLPYVVVPSADKAAATCVAGGGKILNGPMDIPGGRIAQCMDPQGGAFAVHSLTPAPAATKPAKPAAKRSVKKAARTTAARKTVKKSAKTTAKKAVKKAPKKKTAKPAARKKAAARKVKKRK